MPLLIIDDLGMRKLAAHRRRGSPGADHAPLRTRLHAADVESPVDDWGKLLGDTAAVTALLDRLLHHAHVLKCGPRSWRTKVAHRFAHRGGNEVKLTGLGRRQIIAGFDLSINCRFSAVHRGAGRRHAFCRVVLAKYIDAQGLSKR